MKPKRIISLLLAICLVAGLMPTVAFATESDKAIMLGTSGISGFDTAKGGTGYDYIYFGSWKAQDKYTTSGPIKWRVLDDQTNFDSDSNGTNDAGLFLLSDGLLGTGTDGGVFFQQISHLASGKYHKGSAPTDGNHTKCQIANAWQGSDAQAWCKDFENSSLDSRELAAILETTKDDTVFTSSTKSVQFAASNGILNGDKVFFLSAEEAETSSYGFRNADDRKAIYGSNVGFWWLRSPHASVTSNAGLVTRFDDVSSNSGVTPCAARPAFNLDQNSVLFTSAAVGGKSSGAESGGQSGEAADGGNQGGGNQSGEAADAIFEIDSYDGNEWKLTLLDSSRDSFAISDAKINGDGDTIAFSYSGAQIGTNEYISVVLETNNEITHYGRILQLDGTTNSASGTASLTLPADVTLSDTTKLYIFNEQYNGDYMTDYASPLRDIGSPTAPTLTAGTATRTGETTATVKFTSDEAGSYYYVLDNNATAPDSIDTSGEGTSCSANTETTITLDSLSGEYIHIVVKDAVGNVSQPLTIPIPAYTYTLTVNLNGGSGSDTGGQYPAGEVVNIDAGSRSNYRFDGWTSSNGGSFDDASSASTTFTMPAADTTITAAWSYVGGGSTTDYYRLTFDTNGGSEIASILRAEYTTVDLSDYKPTREGYEFTGWYADKDLTDKITSIRLTCNTTVYAGWEEKKENPFTDVSENDWFYDDVMFVFANDLMVGTGDATFSPEISTSRAMIAVTLWRMEGEPSAKGANPFTDVENGAWYTEAITWANENGIAEGYGNGCFQPETPVTREQLAAFFYRYAAYKGYDITITGSLDHFNDKDNVSEWAKDTMAWAVGYGLIGGKDNNMLDPQGEATRAEFAAMLQRFCQKG